VNPGENKEVWKCNGAYGKKSEGSGFIAHTDREFFLYDVPTAPGSSGSPVFNQQGKVVGIHHSFLTLQQLRKGTRMDAIFRSFQTRYLEHKLQDKTMYDELPPLMALAKEEFIGDITKSKYLKRYWEQLETQKVSLMYLCDYYNCTISLTCQWRGYSFPKIICKLLINNWENKSNGKFVYYIIDFFYDDEREISHFPMQKGMKNQFIIAESVDEAENRITWENMK